MRSFASLRSYIFSEMWTTNWSLYPQGLSTYLSETTETIPSSKTVSMFWNASRSLFGPQTVVVECSDAGTE